MSDYNFKEEKIKSPIDGSNNCFKVFTEPATDEHYLCMSTGYMASSHFKLGDDKFQREMNNSPELVKALQHYDDETGLIWIPTVLNMGKLGMIFPEGNLENWSWCYAKNIEIPEDEQKNYPIPGKDGEFLTRSVGNGEIVKEEGKASNGSIEVSTQDNVRIFRYAFILTFLQ